MRDIRPYTINGERWPSVTEILELCGLTPYSSLVDWTKVLEAGRRGKYVHDWCELIDNGLVDEREEPDIEILGYVEAYRAYKAEFDPGYNAIELMVRSDTYRYVGRLDRVIEARKGPHQGLWLIDLKAAAQVTPATRLQLAGYLIAYAPETLHAQEAGPGRACLQLRADGRYDFTPYRDSADIHDWLAAVRIAHFKLRHGMAQIPEEA